jgi:hypothetical protein
LLNPATGVGAESLCGTPYWSGGPAPREDPPLGFPPLRRGVVVRPREDPAYVPREEADVDRPRETEREEPRDETEEARPRLGCRRKELWRPPPEGRGGRKRFATWSKAAVACDSVTAPPEASRASVALAVKPGASPDVNCRLCCSAMEWDHSGSHVRRNQSSKTEFGPRCDSMERREAARDVRDRTEAAVADRSRPFSICWPSLRRVVASRQPAVQMAGRRQPPGGRGRPTDHDASGRDPF